MTDSRPAAYNQEAGRHVMINDSFEKFRQSGDCLRVYDGDTLVFSSKEKGVRPLLEYIDSPAPGHDGVVVFDRVTGNAAALLSVKAGGRAVYSLMGSELAAATLAKRGLEYRFAETVPYIKNRDATGMCPMEKLSLGKDVEECYRAVQEAVKGAPGG